jgi:hypothetical protein
MLNRGLLDQGIFEVEGRDGEREHNKLRAEYWNTCWLARSEERSI